MKKNKNNIKTARLQKKLQKEACNIAINLFSQTYPHTHTLVNARVRWFAYTTTGYKCAVSIDTFNYEVDKNIDSGEIRVYVFRQVGYFVELPRVIPTVNLDSPLIDLI